MPPPGPRAVPIHFGRATASVGFEVTRFPKWLREKCNKMTKDEAAKICRSVKFARSRRDVAEPFASYGEHMVVEWEIFEGPNEPMFSSLGEFHFNGRSSSRETRDRAPTLYVNTAKRLDRATRLSDASGNVFVR